MEPFSPNTRQAVLQNPTGSHSFAQNQHAPHHLPAFSSAPPTQLASPLTTPAPLAPMASSVSDPAPAGSPSPPVPPLSPPGSSSSSSDSSWTTNSSYPTGRFNLDPSLALGAPSGNLPTAPGVPSPSPRDIVLTQARRHQHLRDRAAAEAAFAAARSSSVFALADQLRREAAEVENHATYLGALADQSRHVAALQLAASATQADNTDQSAEELRDCYRQRVREAEAGHARAAEMYRRVDELTRTGLRSRAASGDMNELARVMERELQIDLELLGLPTPGATRQTDRESAPDLPPRSDEWLRNSVPPTPRPAFAQMARVPMRPTPSGSHADDSGHAHPVAAPYETTTASDLFARGPGNGGSQMRGDARVFYPRGSALAAAGGAPAPPVYHGGFADASDSLPAPQPSTTYAEYVGYGYRGGATGVHPRRQAAATEMPGSPMGPTGHALPAHPRRSRRFVQTPPASPPGSPCTEAAFWVEMRCAICREQLADTAILPCGHCSVCRWCFANHINGSEDWSRLCPFCRQRITSSARLFRNF